MQRRKKWDNLEINIYAGANGKFVLYEDESKKLRMRTLFEDGNTMDNPITQSEVKGKVRYDDDLGQGEYYLVEANGNLGLYGADGKFDEAKLIK